MMDHTITSITIGPCGPNTALIHYNMHSYPSFLNVILHYGTSSIETPP